jgi:hypothetical protein
MREKRGSAARAALAAVMAFAACAAPTSATEINTGSQCVTALHADPESAGPLPSRLISLLGPQGQRMLADCDSCANYPAIAADHATQVTQAFCGVASSITVLNASDALKPLTDPYKPYRYFTQCNIFNAKARQRLDLDTVANEGLTLAQATWLLNAQAGVHATCFHAGESGGTGGVVGANSVPGCKIAGSAAEFREVARRVLDRQQHYLLVNFSRATLSDDNTGGGDFSPLAAYNRVEDDLLVMEVARYKYPPFWVDSVLLWSAMATTDTSSGRHRGFIVVEVESGH